MWLPALLYVLALGLRLTWIGLVPSKPVGDFAMYLESATYLLEHGRFDPEFIYMPGYVLLAAGVQALGGTWMATKVAGALLAAAGAPLVFGMARRLWGGRAATVAGLLYALWPGGIGVASVTGTDIPAAVLVAAAAWALLQARPDAPWRAALVAGAFFGLAAWIRAVALPLAPLSVFFLRARTGSWRRATAGAACTTLAAALVLAPWGFRNHARYGAWFLTDSHGGLTALVGAYPNSDGQFTRALNRMVETVTGTPWLGEPHREADARAYEEAKRWTRFEPRYALGLAIQRADKLLSNERSLLYWPLYRDGVLREPAAGFFERWRPEIERATDLFWWALLASCLAGTVLGALERRPETLGLLPFQLALAGVYVLFFAESRYHLPIAVLAFPNAAGCAVRAWDAVRLRSVPALPDAPAPAPAKGLWNLAAALIATALVLALSWVTVSWGDSLRARHRFAVHACEVKGSWHYCLWRSADPGRSGRPSPVKGVFDGVGLSLGSEETGAETLLPLGPGSHRLHAQLTAIAPGQTGGEAFLLLDGREHARVPLSRLQGGLGLTLSFETQGAVRLALRGVAPQGGRVWLEGLRVE